MNDEEVKRYRNNIDTYSLLEGDGELPSAEDTFIQQEVLPEILRTLSTDREKFIALALYHGFNRVEIARMIPVNRSQITRSIQNMRIKLVAFRKAKPTC